MPSFADLKAKAEGWKDNGVQKYQNTRDKHSSVPLKSTNWDPYDRKRPLGTPPQPANSAQSQDYVGSPSGAPPPPVSRGTKPGGQPRPPKPALPPPPSRTGSHASTSAASIGQSSTPPAPAPRPAWRASVAETVPADTGIAKIDWANLSQEDKVVFFSWLDEFFEAFLARRDATVASSSSASNIPPFPSRSGADSSHVAARDEERPASESPFNRFGVNLNKGNVKALAEKARTNNPFAKMQGHVEEDAKPPTPKPSLVEGDAQGPPPPVARWNRPEQVSSSAARSPTGLTMSYPPPATSTSHAADLASFFDPYTHWSTSWYTSTSSLLPPQVASRKDISYTGSWMSRGTAKTCQAAVLFPDLSLCWTTVSFSTSHNADPNDGNAVQREAVWRDVPAVLDAQTLQEASETYGEAIAGFAESFVDSGEYCGRGECWDLAAHALQYVGGFTADGVPAPVPSISRTHGHLIFEGSANGRGLGRWRGDDRVIRRGDIVEWREVRIDRPGGGWSMLGDPDHTAVVVQDAHPSSLGADDAPISLASLGLTLLVAEQSVSTGIMPKRETYDVSAMTKGEVWVYRPVAWATYMGFEPEVEVVDEASGGGAKAKIPVKCPDGLDVGRMGT